MIKSPLPVAVLKVFTFPLQKQVGILIFIMFYSAKVRLNKDYLVKRISETRLLGENCHFTLGPL